MNKPFTSSQFTPTKWDTAEDKAKFANHLVRFVQSGYKKSLFYNWFYRRLSMTFGHIAHYNREGFYDYFFTTQHESFLTYLRTGGGYGDPHYTYSDVELAIRRYFHK